MKEGRRYPSRPLVGAGAVVHRRRRVLLLKRRYPPNQGRWALPGGMVELGESVQEAARREIKEETGLEVELEGLLDVQTDIHRDEYGRIEYHYILVDYLASVKHGRVRLNEESADYGWFSEGEVKRLGKSEGTKRVLEMTFRQHLR